MNWERWLNIAGSIASISALSYLIYKLSNGESPGTAGVAGLGDLPTHGRIPMATVKRALKRLPKRTRACGITPALLREGMEIEREHRDITRGAVGTTAKIAAAHICERPDYYKRIKRYVEA